MMALAAGWGMDLQTGPTGDIAVLTGRTEIQYRMIRRLLTNPGDYIWHAKYGAGLGGYVGRPFSSQLIESTILYHIQHETLIASAPPPKITTDNGLDASFSTASVTIQYHTRDMPDGNAAVIGFNI